MAAEQPEVGVARREEAVDAHMPLRDHRMKHAVHPRGGRERGFIGDPRASGTEQMAMRAEDLQLLGPENHMAPLSTEE